MNIEQINNLKKDESTGLFDINQSVFRYTERVIFFPHFVEKEEEMRMDLISNRLYQTTEHTAFLCRLNNIINPLNIKEGTLLIYVSENNIDSFTPPDDTFVEEIKQTLLNLSKKRRIDENREKFNKENLSLPPVFNNVDFDSVILSNEGVITIRPSNT